MPLDQLVRPEAPAADGTSPEPGPGRRRRRGAGVLAVVLVLAILGGLAVQDDVRRAARVVAADEPILTSDKTVLADLWGTYKDTFIGDSGRTVDPQADGITTSEGESYTMLRAVWMDDQRTFDDSWQWTKDNLQRDDDLMAWKFGERSDGTYGIQEEDGGANSATDADVDIAFALLMAYSRWKDDDYLYDALPVIEAVWEKSVVQIQGRPVLVANDLERFERDGVLLNPSYFAPYAYRVFAEVDPDRDWRGLVDSSYELLARLDRAPLDASSPAGLPPDWVVLYRESGALGAPSGEMTTRFGYDALRLPWRLALDHRWYGEERARQLLERQSVLARTWTAEQRLVAGYDREGRPAADHEAPAMYGGALGFFEVVEPALARDVYAEKLLPLYDADRQDVAEPLGYYDSNWVWFGMAMHLDELPNLNVTEK